VAGPLVVADHHFIGDHVQLLLCFALYVLGVQRAHDADQRALVDGIGDGLDGGDDVVQQRGELAGGAGNMALFFDDELGKRGAGMHRKTFGNLMKA
jgi:hypothetical protein